MPWKNLFASPNQGCNGGWDTDFCIQIIKIPKEKNRPLQSYEKGEITGSVLGPVHIY